MKQIIPDFNQFLSIIFVCFVFIVTSQIPANAVIFASDAVYLYAGDARIIEDRVVVKYSGYSKDFYEVCENGGFWIRQGPDWQAGPYEFYWYDNKEAMVFELWVKTEAGRSSEDVSTDYQLYLAEFVEAAPYQLTTTIPDIDTSPPLEIKSIPAPKTGMTGGRIGNNRYFRLQLFDGELTQITWSEARNSPVLSLPDSLHEF